MERETKITLVNCDDCGKRIEEPKVFYADTITERTKVGDKDFCLKCTAKLFRKIQSKIPKEVLDEATKKEEYTFPFAGGFVETTFIPTFKGFS